VRINEELIEIWLNEVCDNEDEKVLRELVPKNFLKWRRVFGKKESERMPV